MFPGINPKMMKQAMKRMGIQQIDIPATEVIIKTEDKDLVITNPQVSKVNMMGQETFQIIGEVHEQEKSAAPEISEEDVQTIMEQTGADKKTAEKALKEHEGDLAETILDLKKE